MHNDSSGRVRKRRIAILTAAASAAALALVAPTAAIAAPSSPATSSGARAASIEGATSCDLVNSTITATSTVNAGLTQRFDEYGDTGGAWTGGDSTYSLPLSGGRLGWFFSDTFLGTVNPDGSRPVESTFINQSIVVDAAGTLSTVTGGTPSAPDSIIPPTPEGKWHWLGDPAQGKHGDVQIPLLQFEKFGPDLWDFRWTANRLATLDGETLTLEEVTELPSATGTNWTSYTLQQGSKTYVYGIRDVDGVRSAFVARVTGNDGLKGNWKFWDGSTGATPRPTRCRSPPPSRTSSASSRSTMATCSSRTTPLTRSTTASSPRCRARQPARSFSRPSCSERRSPDCGARTVTPTSTPTTRTSTSSSATATPCS